MAGTVFSPATRSAPDPRLNELWSMAEEVNTTRGILVGGAQAGVTGPASLAAFQKLYPCKSADIEQVIVHDWSKDGRACASALHTNPANSAASGRKHPVPAGAFILRGYAAQMSWGQEAALESANRAAREIDQA
jgi:hypothetical protein